MALLNGYDPERYARVSRHMLRDGQLSARAKGVGAYIASHAEGYRLTVAQLIGEMRDGRDAVRAALRELEDTGYLVRVQRHGEGGRFEEPDLLLRETPATGSQAPAATSGKATSPQVTPGPGNPATATPPLRSPVVEDKKNLSDASGAGPTPTGDTMTAVSHDPNQLGLDGMPDAPPPKPKKVSEPHTVYLAYEAAYHAEHGKPSLRKVGWTRGEAKRLLAAGEPLDKVVAAAESMARGGNIFNSIETERRTLRDQEERQARAAANLVDGWGAAPRDFDAERVYE